MTRTLLALALLVATGAMLYGADDGPKAAGDYRISTATLTTDSLIGSGPLLADFGSVILHGNDTATTISSQGTYVQVDTNNTAALDGDARNFSLIDAETLGLQLDAAEQRVCMFTATIGSHRDAGSSEEFGFVFALDGVPDAGTVVHRSLSSASDSGNVSLVWCVLLQPGAQVTVEVTSVGGTEDLTVEEAVMTAVAFQ